MIPEVRRYTNPDPMNPVQIDIVCGGTAYPLNMDRLSHLPHDCSLLQVIDAEARNLTIFHERRYVKQPYKIPLRRPAR